MRAHLPLPARRLDGSPLGHDTVDAAKHVEVVAKKVKPGAATRSPCSWCEGFSFTPTQPPARHSGWQELKVRVPVGCLRRPRFSPARPKTFPANFGDCCSAVNY